MECCLVQMDSEKSLFAKCLTFIGASALQILKDENYCSFITKENSFQEKIHVEGATGSRIFYWLLLSN